MTAPHPETPDFKAEIKRRLHLVQTARENPALQRAMLEMCRRDIFYWFDHFCWTFDPRIDEPHQPFILYPYQRELVVSFCEAIDKGEDLLIEKSRDMGVSWLILLVFQYYWLFRPGSNFHLGSRKTEYVDRKGDISTLFEKLRYNLDWLPHWMKPQGFRAKHDNILRKMNPANGNIITGESSNENFARGGRYKAVLFDEFPFWPVADAAYASAGQSTPSRFVIGTPYGKSNRFAEIRFEGRTRIESIHWSRHPLKDEAWYERQIRRMSEDEIARELDINYHLSQKDRVFKQFNATHKAALPRLPEGKRVVRSWDFGYHCPACVFVHLDADGRVLVLREEVGDRELLKDFGERVLRTSAEHFPPETMFEDICDPAGAQKSDKSDKTSIEILNTLGVHPYHDRSRILDGVELIRMKLAERVNGEPGLVVDTSCEKLIEAFEGGYRYPAGGRGEMPVQEHPFEDVMDCLRYAVMSKCSLPVKIRKPTKRYRPANRYTGY